MLVGWAPRWTGQTERTSLLTLGALEPTVGAEHAASPIAALGIVEVADELAGQVGEADVP